MIYDLQAFAIWWVVLFFIGLIFFPLASTVFSNWYDRGYFFSKALGIAIISYATFLFGVTKTYPFRFETLLSIVIVFIGFNFFLLKRRPKINTPSKTHYIQIVLIEELIFLTLLAAWTFVKAHNPDIHSLEKFMDYGFTKSILNSEYFPPQDMWFSQKPINYYYFGHLTLATLTKLSFLDLSYTFNLMLATLFALAFTMSFSIGYQLMGLGQNINGINAFKATICGLLAATLITLGGNLHTLYAFFDPQYNFIGRLNNYWYANATRFIPNTIHEFPGYSFVVSDLHGHVLDIPYVLLAIAALIQIGRNLNAKSFLYKLDLFVFYGLLCGIMYATNTLDSPIYFGLLIFILTIHFIAGAKKPTFRETAGLLAISLATAYLAVLPFTLNFNSFVQKIGANCAPQQFIGKTLGPLIFEKDRCQLSPFWMLGILWGFPFVATFPHLIGLIKKGFSVFKARNLIIFSFAIFSLLLIIFPEYFYFKDIYSTHFRANTMFKLTYQAFILLSFASAFSLVHLINTLKGFAKSLYVVMVTPLLFLVLIYPFFSIDSYFYSLKKYNGLYGFKWLYETYPTDYAAINFLQKQPFGIVVEADGESFTDYSRFSALTGYPTIIGWAAHEWLWRSNSDEINGRKNDVRIIYESQDIEETKNLLEKYNITYLVLGVLERQKYKIFEEKFDKLGVLKFEEGSTKIYQTNL